MTQRFTVELERTNRYVATVEVEADDVTEARIEAIAKARAAPGHWEADIGQPHVIRIKAHGAQPMRVSASSVECPHCHWGFAPSVIDQHIREKH